MALNTTSIASGVLVALLGAVPLLWIVLSSHSEEVSQVPVASIPVTAVTVDTTPKEMLITTPPPKIEGLTESIARVLVVNGFAAEEALDDLPPSVTRTLSERGIALTIAEEG